MDEELKVPTVQTPEIIEVDYQFSPEVIPTLKKEVIIEEETMELDLVVIEPEMEKITSEDKRPAHIRTEASGSKSVAISAFILSALLLILL